MHVEDRGQGLDAAPLGLPFQPGGDVALGLVHLLQRLPNVFGVTHLDSVELPPYGVGHHS